MKQFSLVIALVGLFAASCAMNGPGGAMGYDPDPATGACSANSVLKIDGTCYDLENARKYCATARGVYGQECAEFAGGKDR